MNAERAPFRELSVADLIEQLAEMPQHYPVTVIVNGVAGVITGVWSQTLTPENGNPHILIGEQPWTAPTVPAEWTEANDPT